MKIYMQLALLAVITLFGELISMLLPIVVPGNVLSMAILLVLMCFKIVKLDTIKETAEFLLANLALFYVPSTVGIMDIFGSIKEYIFEILFICIVMTFVTFAATAYTVIFVSKIVDKVSGGGSNE